MYLVYSVRRQFECNKIQEFEQTLEPLTLTVRNVQKVTYNYFSEHYICENCSKSFHVTFGLTMTYQNIIYLHTEIKYNHRLMKH
jgi:hypothetical protein